MTEPRSGEPFDGFADEYARRLDDPLRRQFATDGDFFIRQKCQALTREIRHRLGPTRGRQLRLLDAGCGAGTAMAVLQPIHSVIGTDVSLPMLQRVTPGGRVAATEPFELPFTDHRFDVAFAFCVYHHIAPAERARHLRELGRVVRPGGLVSIFEHNPRNPVTRRIFERAAIDRGCEMIRAEELHRMFTDAGFTDVQCTYMLFVPEFLASWLGFIEPYLGWLPMGGQYFVSGTKTVA